MSTTVTPISLRAGERRAFLNAILAAVDVLEGQVADVRDAVELLKDGDGPGAQVIQFRPPHRPRAS
jgi:hypothetical protein